MTITKDEAAHLYLLTDALIDAAYASGQGGSSYGNEESKFFAYVDSLTEKPPAPLLSEQIKALPIGTTFTLNVGGTHDPDPRVRVARGYINTVAPGEVYAFDIWDYHENVTLVL